MSFENLGLNDHILKAVERMGFTEPTPIQKKVIPPAKISARCELGMVSK